MTMDEMWPQELQIMARIEGGLEGELHRMLRHLYLAILKVDLMEDTAYLLQSVDQSDKVSCVFSWAEYLTLYSSMLLEEEQSRMLEEFSGYHLAELMQEGVSIYSRDYPYYKQGAVNWVTMTAYLDGIEEGLPTAYITAQVSCEDHFIKSLVDLYVYDKCDYFMYIDSQNSRYSLFSGQSKGLRLPPAPTRDYGEGLARYTEHFVVPEDREMVTRKMELGHILERLEEKGVYSLSCGVADPERGYTRKRLEFRYYDEKTKTLLLSCTDLTDVYLEDMEHQQALKEAQDRARIDPLTGLLNYQGTADKIAAALRAEDGQAALLFIDLDNFKGVNDTLGHAAGDQLLQQVAAVLKRQTRGTDLIGRVGGDEFVVLLRNVGGPENVKAYARRLCASVSEMNFEGVSVSVSCSIGVAQYPKDGTDYRTLVKRADKLTYCAKEEGKNRFVMGE